MVHGPFGLPSPKQLDRMNYGEKGLKYDLLIYYGNNILKKKSYCLINISQELIRINFVAKRD